MRKVYFCLIVFAVLFNACKEDFETELSYNDDEKTVLRINEPDFCKTIFPLATNDIVSSQIISQIFEGLVKYEPKTLSVVPAIAERWEIDTSGMVYTFFLRKNVYFHNDECFDDGKGRNVTANDFYFSFHLLCTQSENNMNFYGTLDKIEGAKEYYENSNENSDNQISGIKVIDDYTLQLTLESPNPLFIYFLANPAAAALPKEGIEKYEIKNHVGSGPFYINGFSEKLTILSLIKNPNYYKMGKNDIQLPYIDTVNITFVGSIQKEINMFEAGELDIVAGLPSKYVPEFLEKHIKEFESNPPIYILNQSEEDVVSEIYNLMRSNVQNFYTNRMNFIDLSLVYFEEPNQIKNTESKNNQ